MYQYTKNIYSKYCVDLFVFMYSVNAQVNNYILDTYICQRINNNKEVTRVHYA